GRKAIAAWGGRFMADGGAGGSDATPGEGARLAPGGTRAAIREMPGTASCGAAGAPARSPAPAAAPIHPPLRGLAMPDVSFDSPPVPPRRRPPRGLSCLGEVRIAG